MVDWRRPLGFLLLAAFPSLVAAQRSKPHLVTSFPPAYWLAINVAGEFAQVENLLPASEDPHDAQLRPREYKKLQSASLLVVNGLGLESWLPRALATLPKEHQPPLVELAAGSDTELIHGSTPLKPFGGGDAGFVSGADTNTNPHVWLDPILMVAGVSNVLAALVRIDPDHTEVYRRRAGVYTDRLLSLDQELRAGLLPLREQPLVTYHDAFPYFTRRYHLNLIGVIETIPDVEPAPHYLTHLLQTIRAWNGRVIITEPELSSRLGRRLAKDMGAVTIDLETLETGELVPDGYEAAMHRNLRVLRQALGGSK